MDLDFQVTDFQIVDQKMHITIIIEESVVEFWMKKPASFAILSITHKGKKYANPTHLSQFNSFIDDVAKRLKPILEEILEDYNSLINSTEYREAQLEIREQDLVRQKLSFDAQIQIMKFQLEALEVENQILEEEKSNKELQWKEALEFALKLLVIVVVFSLIVLMIIFVFQLV